MDPDWVEAIAFAWMAKQRIEGTALDTTPFTGSSQPVVLGGVYSGVYSRGSSDAHLGT
jgi:anhydro-N-acetylmuramic acid kinase